MDKLLKKLTYKGTIEALTGMHIGRSKEGVEIGGVDLGVIKDSISGKPYIPGSSLKGKLRSLLEQAEGTSEPTFDLEKSPCSGLFGGIKKGRDGVSRSSRLIVRDAFMSEVSAKTLSESPNMELPYTEVKWENSIDRVQGKAQDPRQIERVPAGTSFDAAFVINIFNESDEKSYPAMLKKAIKMLEADYLGGSGTRGYGQVKVNIDWDNPEVLDTQNLV